MVPCQSDTSNDNDFLFCPLYPLYSPPHHAHNTLSKDYSVSVSALKSANNPHDPTHKYLYRQIKTLISFFYLFEYCDLMYNEDVKKIIGEIFCDSVSRKEAKPCFILHLLSHQVKWHDEFYHTISPFRGFLNECQFSLTQLSDGNPHWRMIVTPLTF